MEDLKDQKLHAFDMLLIISAGRFTEFDIEIAKAATESNVKFPSQC